LCRRPAVLEPIEFLVNRSTRYDPVTQGATRANAACRAEIVFALWRQSSLLVNFERLVESMVGPVRSVVGQI
jgi:hypothetical protein